MLQSKDKIYVAGHRGLAGSAIVRQLRKQGFDNLITRTHGELDLTAQQSVTTFLQQEKPDVVILAAAKVGGILANRDFPAEFIYSNIAIQTHVIHGAHRAGVQRLLFLGSSCIYPRQAPQPLREEYLLTGPLESTNRPYAVAKIAGIEMCWAYNRQYGTRYIAVMPTNLYGPGDNYDLQSAHVLPALIHKMHLAKQAQSPSVVCWGTGSPRREFLHSDDMAAACVRVLTLKDDALATLATSTTAPPMINVGCGEDLSIGDLAKLVADIVEYRGQLVWDASKPDGTSQKLLDIDRLKTLGWTPTISLRDGIAAAYQDFLKNQITRPSVAR